MKSLPLSVPFLHEQKSAPRGPFPPESPYSGGGPSLLTHYERGVAPVCVVVVHAV